jgi:sodium/potassium/calcium exchanger 6
MAAVTLLALANGAGDVITALVASGSSDGLAYNIGSIYGAGLVPPLYNPSSSRRLWSP